MRALTETLFGQVDADAHELKADAAVDGADLEVVGPAVFLEQRQDRAFALVTDQVSNVSAGLQSNAFIQFRSGSTIRHLPGQHTRVADRGRGTSSPASGRP